MKFTFKKGLLLLTAALLVGCTTTSDPSSETPSTSLTSDPSSETPSSSEPPSSEIIPLTAAEFDVAYNHIALTVPLAVEKGVGAPIRTNIFRTTYGINEMPNLKDGNDIVLITTGFTSYENDDTEVYFETDYTISWSYLEHELYGAFEFDTDRNGNYFAVPGYPEYRPEYVEMGTTPINVPNSISARLYAGLTIGEFSRNISIDVILGPKQIIDFASLLEVRELPDNTIIGVRGYVHGIHADWNSVGIADGIWGLGLYRVDSGFVGSMQVGELVEVVGEVKTFNRLPQVQYLKSVKILDPADWPEIEEPAVQEYSLDELADQLDRSSSDLTGPLQDKENALVKFTEPFRFLRVEDRNRLDVGFAGFDLSGAKHTNVILEGTTSGGDKFEVKLSMNYHIGGAEQLKFKTWLEANQESDIYYTGPLSQFNELVLGPYHFTEGVTLRTTY